MLTHSHHNLKKNVIIRRTIAMKTMFGESGNSSMQSVANITTIIFISNNNNNNNTSILVLQEAEKKFLNLLKFPDLLPSVEEASK